MKEMQDSHTAHFFSPIKQSLLAALKILTPHLEEIDEAWQALLQGLPLSEEQYKALCDFDFRGNCRRLKSSRFEDFRLYLETYGRELEQLGVTAEHVTCAVAFYLVMCLRYILPTGAKEREMIVALTRVLVAGHRFLFSGYGDQVAQVYKRIDEQERHKLSRDLHDDVGHNLVVLKLYMEMISKDLTQGDAEQIKPKLEEAKALIAHTIESVRRLILDLGPALLEETGLVSAIRLYSRQFSARTGIKVTIQDAGIPETLPSSHEIALYRVLQGALSNVVKHSRAQNVKVIIGGAKQAKVIMIIEDDGVGFDFTSERPKEGFGLRAMRERIEALGGRFHMESWPAKFGQKHRGTRIEIDLPVPLPEAI